MNNVLLLCGLLSILTFVVAQSETQSTLRLVNLVYRHGDRSPVTIFPTDTNKEDKWPQGLGWLSTIGMQQQYALGKWLWTRYVDTGFMSADYKHDELEVMSSDEDRTLMSAYCNLAGLYPPSGNQTWNANITWQPIPVHTKPASEDNMLNLGENCPKYDELLQQTYTSPPVVAEEKRNKAFYDWLGEKSGVKPVNITDVWKITDTLFCERSHNMTLVPWVNETVYDLLRVLSDFQFTMMYNSVQKSRLMGGPLLNEYISKMQDKVNASDMKAKMFMYSGHDTTVSALLSALNVFNDESPPYTATVIAELHEKPKASFYVNLFYKNTTDTVTLLTLPNCTFDCPLDQFVELTKPVIPVDWVAECSLGGHSSSKIHLSTAWIVAIALGSVLAIVVVVLIVCLVKHKKSSRSPSGKFDILA